MRKDVILKVIFGDYIDDKDEELDKSIIMGKQDIEPREEYILEVSKGETEIAKVSDE